LAARRAGHLLLDLGVERPPALPGREAVDEPLGGGDAGHGHPPERQPPRRPEQLEPADPRAVAEPDLEARGEGPVRPPRPAPPPPGPARHTAPSGRSDGPGSGGSPPARRGRCSPRPAPPPPAAAPPRRPAATPPAAGRPGPRLSHPLWRSTRQPPPAVPTFR